MKRTVPLILLCALGCTTHGERAPASAPATILDDTADRLDEEPPPDRDEATRLVLEGRALREGGDHGAAFEVFERARAADPSYGLAHLEGAICAQYIGLEDERVRERFDQAAMLLDDSPRVHFERAAFEESHGHAEAAVTGYRRALDLRPSLLDARLALGRALMTTGDIEAARETFRQVLEVDPKSVPALLGKADAAERLGDHDGAERALKAIVDGAPDVAFHRQRLIAFYERTGQAKKVESEKKRLEKADPQERRRLRSLKPSRRRR